MRKNRINAQFLKAVIRALIAADGQHVSKLANTLQPRIDPKTLDRILKNGHFITTEQQTALAGFCIERVGCSRERLSQFELDPTNPEYIELLSLAVGESYPVNDRSLRALNRRIAELEGRTTELLVYDTGWPSDFYLPSSDSFGATKSSGGRSNPRRTRPHRTIHTLLSVLKAKSRAERPFGFGNQDDQDEAIEQAIDAVVTHHFGLRIIDDLSSSISIPEALAPYERVTIFDCHAALVQRRDSCSVSLILANTDAAPRGSCRLCMKRSSTLEIGFVMNMIRPP